MNHPTQLEQSDGYQAARLTLLGLPPELRDHILSFALVETIKWERRHKSHCASGPRTSTEIEYPPFLLEETRDRTRHCRCIARSSLDVLIVSRQLYAEGAHIFWTKNTFCFKSMAEFSRTVGRTLRPGTRKMIRHISLVGYGASSPSEPNAFDGFWASMLQCTGLRTLELDPNTVSARGSRQGGSPCILGHFLRMKTELPHLRSVRWVCAGSFWTSVGNPLQFGLHPMSPQTAIWETTKTVDVQALEAEADVQRSKRDFENFAARVGRALQAKILEMVFGVQSSEPKPLPGGDNDSNDQEAWRLEDGSVATLRFYGLPLSRGDARRENKRRNEEDEFGVERPGLSRKRFKDVWGI